MPQATSQLLGRRLDNQALAQWQIQLGAFRLPSAPQKLFDSLSGQLSGKRPTFQQVGNVTRLLVGRYATAAEARAACRSLKARSGCLAVRTP